MRRPSRSAGSRWTEREDSRAQTEPRACEADGPLPPPPSADASSLAAYVPWLEQIALRLIRERASADVLTCERLIADLKDLEDLEDRAAADAAVAPAPAFAASPMAGDIRFVLGGLRAILRAIGSGDLPLDPELRTELSELVRDVVEVVMAVDLAPASRRR